MKELPEDAVAVRLKNGNVYHPIWPRDDKPGWFTGTCVLGTHVGGTSMFNPPMVGKAFSQNAYDVLRLTWTAAEQERARLAELAPKTEPPEEPATPATRPRPEPQAEPAKPRQFPISVHMIVKATTQEEAERFVRDRLAGHLNDWFCEDTAQTPSPVGSLLWYRYDAVASSGKGEE